MLSPKRLKFRKQHKEPEEYGFEFSQMYQYLISQPKFVWVKVKAQSSIGAPE